VPTPSYPTIGAAVRDGACTLVQVAAGDFPENVTIARDVAIQGAGSGATSIQGRFAVSGAGTDVSVNSLEIDGTAAGVAGCWAEMLKSTEGATVTSASDVRVRQSSAAGGACRLFVDGFEFGGALGWSSSVP
jgi:hypothetical protein